MKYNYLYDTAFLKEIDNQRNQVHYVKIIVLSLEEAAIAAIEGIVTSGNINVNGSSAVRRTGSLSLVATQIDGKDIFNITDINNLISIEKRVEIEIGLENFTSSYPEEKIIWFPQGQFVITSASVQHNTQNISISIGLKDKMALLNGECGGTLSIGLTHSPLYETGEDGSIIKTPVPFVALIKTLVHEYGGIPENKIIIDNIPERIKNIVRWTGGYPVYGYESPKIEEYEEVETLPSAEESMVDKIYYQTKDHTYYICKKIKIEDKDVYVFKRYLQTYVLTTAIPTVQNYDTFSFGDSLGYEYTDYVYPTESELSSNAGDTIVSVLDKIKNTLGNFEYFFDLDGYFHFQQIKDYINEGSDEGTIVAAIKDGFDYLSSYSTGKSVYNFDNNELVTVFANSPKYEAIKNDICVWGVRGDNKSPIQYHLVIDDVPSLKESKTWNVVFYEDEIQPGIIRARAPKNGEATNVSIEAIFNENPEAGSVKITLSTSADAFTTEGIIDYRTMMYYDYIINKSEYTLPYGKELQENWPKIFDLSKNQFRIENFSDSKIFMNSMPYFFEIIDPKQNDQSLLKDLKVSNIGRRPKVLNDNNVNILLTPMPPEWTYIEAGTAETAAKRNEAIKNNEDFIQTPQSLARHISLGAQTNSAYDAVRAMLHELISYNESVNITTVPIYHLEPNTRITAKDADIGVEPTDYIIKSFSVPLTANGTMTLQCTKAMERI